MGKQKNVVARIIELGYGLPGTTGGGVLWFRVGATPTSTQNWQSMLKTMSEIQYGEFNGDMVAQMLAFRGKDRQILLVEFGREYSPVLYLHFNHDKLPKLARGDEKAIADFMISIRIEYGIVPDEADWDPSRRCLRLWWD